MNVRTLIALAQRGHQESRELLIHAPGLCITNPRELADLISLRANENPIPVVPYPVDRNALRDIAVHFHNKAGTLTKGVHHNLELFASGAPLLRIAHQPNTFAYLGVYAQFIFWDALARSLFSRHHILPCQVYLIVDFDNAGDKRFRTNHFPDVEISKGFFPLSAPVQKDSFDKVLSAIEKPTEGIVREWISSLESVVERDLTFLRRKGIFEKELGQTRECLEVLGREIETSYNRASSLSEFNAIFLSRIVNLYWKMPTAFFPLSQATSLMKSCYEYLLQNYPIIVKLSNRIIDQLQSKGVSISNGLRANSETFPFWFVCPNCSVRVPLKFLANTNLSVAGVCPKCESDYQYRLGTLSSPDLTPIHDKIIPRILFDVLTDIIGWRISGGVGYIGGAEHALVCGLLASELGLHAPPECLWRPLGIYNGFAEIRAAQILSEGGCQHMSEKAKLALQEIFSGKASILYYLLAQGFDGLLQTWYKHFQNGGQVYEVNMGRNPFVAPESLELLLKAEMEGVLLMTK